jgi:hypothetical protein
MVVQVQHLQLQVHQSLEQAVVLAQQEIMDRLELLVLEEVVPLDLNHHQYSHLRLQCKVEQTPAVVGVQMVL